MNYKGKTIFRIIVFPLMIIMLIEGLLLYRAFEKTGTIQAAQENSIQLLNEKLANKTSSLEYNFNEWSSLDTITKQINSKTASYMEQNQYSYEDLTNGTEITEQYLKDVSGDIVNLIHNNSVTGAFMLLGTGLGDSSYLSKMHRYSGVYFRSTDKFINMQDYSGIVLERGPESVADNLGILLDRNWKADFLYHPLEEENNTDFFMKPLYAAYSYPNLNMDDLGYWAEPFYLNGEEKNSTSIITYAQPVYDSNRNVYAIIGVEVSVELLLEQINSMDNERSDQSYYFISYKDSQDNGEEVTCNVEFPLVKASGMPDIDGSLVLSKEKGKSKTYKVMDLTWEDADLYGKLSEFSLYRAHSPFVGNAWAILAVSNSEDLFYTSRTVIRYSCIVMVLTLLLGVLLAYLLGSFADRRIKRLTFRLKALDIEDHMEVEEQPLVEVKRLEDTVILMREQFKQALYTSRKERERYLVSLESSADAVFEYDRKEDSFCIYQFKKGDGKSADLKETKIEHFIENMITEEYCKREDVSSMTNFLNGRYIQKIEVQMRTSKEVDYTWMAIRGRALSDEEGKVRWIIGNIRKIDEAKERQRREQESNSIDKATKLLNYEVGESMVRKYLSSKKKEEGFSLCMIDLDEFVKINECYGFLYGDIILEEVGEILRRYIHDEDIGVRLGGDEFIICLKDITKEETYRICNSICKNIEMMYIGDEKVTQLTCSIGFVYRTGFVDYTNLLRYAGSAMCEVKTRKQQRIGEYFELRDEPENHLGINEFDRGKVISEILSVGYNDNVVSTVYNILEKGIHFKNSLRVILKKIAYEFGLSRILIVNTNMDEGSDRIEEQWYMFGMEPVHADKFHYDKEIYDKFFSLLDHDHIFLLNHNMDIQYPPALQSMMHFSKNQTVMYDAIYDGDRYLGYIQFKKATQEKKWNTEEVNTLKKLVDIISVHYIRNRNESYNIERED